MTPEQITDNKATFIALCHEHIHREGLDKLLDYLETTDFYTAPSSTKEYVFSGLRPYILNILNNKGGIATDEDINLTLTPIDVASYTQMSNYYYYYGSSQTVVTKISPAVSQPAIAKLRLDKAKIKVVYSKQSVY